jgi:hypothetical protein
MVGKLKGLGLIRNYGNGKPHEILSPEQVEKELEKIRIIRLLPK